MVEKAEGEEEKGMERSLGRKFTDGGPPVRFKISAGFFNNKQTNKSDELKQR